VFLSQTTEGAFGLQLSEMMADVRSPL